MSLLFWNEELASVLWYLNQMTSSINDWTTFWYMLYYPYKTNTMPIQNIATLDSTQYIFYRSLGCSYCRFVVFKIRIVIFMQIFLSWIKGIPANLYLRGALLECSANPFISVTYWTNWSGCTLFIGVISAAEMLWDSYVYS